MTFSFFRGQKGFTLVELLVVLSIMSFLASIVITSVSGARTKGLDSSIKQTMNNMRPQAQLYYENQSSFTYSGVCADVTGISPMVTEVNRLSMQSGTCADGATNWAFASALKTSASFWCVDASGVARSKNALGVSYTAVIPPTTGTTLAPALATASATVCN